MSDKQILPKHDIECLREAKELMDAIIQTLPADWRGSPLQNDTVIAMAGNLGADRFRACMARPAPKR